MSEKSVDQILVERVQQGDKTAFDTLVIKYQHRLHKLVARYIRDPNEVPDITQEAFLKAYRALPGFRGDSAFYTWLYRIAINTAKNHLVWSARRPPIDDIDNVVMESTESGLEVQENATPERMALRDEIQRTVIGAIDELPGDLRTAIILRELEGFSYEDIALTMECPIGTVRSRIFRARQAINSRLSFLLGS